MHNYSFLYPLHRWGNRGSDHCIDLSQVPWLLSGGTGGRSQVVAWLPFSFHCSTSPLPPRPSPPLPSLNRLPLPPPPAWQQIHSHQTPSSATKVRQLQSWEMGRIQRPHWPCWIQKEPDCVSGDREKSLQWNRLQWGQTYPQAFVSIANPHLNFLKC